MSAATCTGELGACPPEQGTADSWDSDAHEPRPFTHLPVSGDAGLVGMLDITDVCRALIDPHFAQRPTTGNDRSR
jgi:hypothetical protein